jgi:hypothetical protein
MIKITSVIKTKQIMTEIAVNYLERIDSSSEEKD